LCSGDGFGLTQTERTLDGLRDRCVAVYPRMQPVRTELFLRTLWDASSAAAGCLEDPTMIRSTRDYLQTDHFKRINWRVTARQQRTIVNTYETILPRSAHFVLDGESFNGPVPAAEQLEDTLSILTSLLLRLEDAGVCCSLSLPRCAGGPPREIAGTAHTPLEEMLFALAGYELMELAQPENPEDPPYARPSEFWKGISGAWATAGRVYYLCFDSAHVNAGGLLTRLDAAKTVLLPYAPAGEDARLGLSAAVGLCTLKGGLADAGK
jgi:hypothetical protein